MLSRFYYHPLDGNVHIHIRITLKIEREEHSQKMTKELIKKDTHLLEIFNTTIKEGP